MTYYAISLDLINKQDPPALTYLKKNADGAYNHPDVIANIAADNNQALRLACHSGHLGVVNMLLRLNEDGVPREFPAVADGIAARDNEALRAMSYMGVPIL